MQTLLLSFLVASLGWLVEPNGLTISDQKVTCIVNRNTSWEDLQTYKTQLWEKKKIRLDIEQVDYNQAKQITQIKISVDCNDGFKGSAQSVFKDEKSAMRFYRVYDKTVSSPFGIGSISEGK